MQRYVLPLVALLACIGIVVAACGDDDTDAGAPVTPAAASANGDTGAMLAALTVIDGAGFHGMDTALNTPGARIDAAWAGKTRRAIVAAKAISWPEEVRDEAVAFSEASTRLLTALEKDDAAGAAKPAKDGHDTQHDLSTKAWELLGTQAGVKAGGSH